jgi:MFS family permease
MSETSTNTKWNPYVIAWVLGLLFYFLEYAVRSAPSIMIPGLSDQFATTAGGVSTIIGAYYITYSITSLAAGMALDKIGVRQPLFTGTLILGFGCILFTLSDYYTGYIGRLLQGMGSAIAFPACVYIATRAFSPKKLATAIGATQSLGMLGGSAGQFIAAPLLKNGMSLTFFWIMLGVVSFIIGLVIYYIIPSRKKTAESIPKQGLFTPYKIVFSNPQSYLSGIVSGLLFAPTTIFAMTWGVAFFQTGRHLSFEAATLACAIVPIGWAIGCPLLGWLADKIGRKPVIIGGATVMILALLQLLFVPDLVPAYISMILLGIASGAAMIPYSIIKEANPDTVKGSATGTINFLTFGVTSLLGPLFAHMYGRTLTTVTDHESHFQQAGLFWVVCIVLAIGVCLFLKETGNKKIN